MRLAVHNPFQIYLFVNHTFDFSIIAQKNRMIQLASCVSALGKIFYVIEIQIFNFVGIRFQWKWLTVHKVKTLTMLQRLVYQMLIRTDI